jgi:hypothetical protein
VAGVHAEVAMFDVVQKDAVGHSAQLGPAGVSAPMMEQSPRRLNLAASSQEVLTESEEHADRFRPHAPAPFLPPARSSRT